MASTQSSGEPLISTPSSSRASWLSSSSTMANSCIRHARYIENVRLEVRPRRRGGGLLVGADDQAAGGADVPWCRLRRARPGSGIRGRAGRHRARRPAVRKTAVGQPGGALGGGLALRAHLERRMRRLVGCAAHARRAHAGVAVGGDGLAAEALHQAERLLQLGHPVLPTEADRLDLLAVGRWPRRRRAGRRCDRGFRDVLGDLHGQDGKQ